MAVDASSGTPLRPLPTPFHLPPSPPPLWRRRMRQTLAEGKLLCNTWLTIGMDPTTGSDQTRETYWMRVKEYFDANNASGNERSVLSLWSRWSDINTDCQKWAGVQANVDVINPSGTNDIDRNSMAQGLFRDVGKKNKKGNKILGKPFMLHHCYEVLGNEEKWKTRGKLEAATMAAMQLVMQQSSMMMAQERLAANEERKLALEEKKLANEEHLLLVEEERKLFLMDTSNLDERKKDYINLAPRKEIL
ncbi:hypothetical protein QYE76_049246 [Lolium multiflorum]|uniref:No apical meristem-associated C-terminal domain-containing protein n=1 Tax=Lolium multiflorum TaxID=4521 RepID=A0AAD8WFW5_LOLMU|nr:hypothetical protein QYE76_049246 [Lolium multiflorum]